MPLIHLLAQIIATLGAKNESNINQNGIPAMPMGLANLGQTNLGVNNVVISYNIMTSSSKLPPALNQNAKPSMPKGTQDQAANPGRKQCGQVRIGETAADCLQPSRNGGVGKGKIRKGLDYSFICIQGLALSCRIIPPCCSTLHTQPSPRIHHQPCPHTSNPPSYN